MHLKFIIFLKVFIFLGCFHLNILLFGRHKTRLQILQLIKDTTEKLKLASEADKNTEISVSISIFFFSIPNWRLEPTCFFNYAMQASKKIADAKLAKDFKAIMQEFQKAQNLAVQRETAYSPFVPQAVLPSRFHLYLLCLLIYLSSIMPK
jgi:syntaxin 7